MNKKIVRWSYLLDRETLETGDFNADVRWLTREKAYSYMKKDGDGPLVKITLEVVE